MAKLATLTDDFEDGAIDPSLWTTSGTVAESVGAAILTPHTTFAILQTVARYDTTESGVVVHIPIVTNNGTSGTLQCGIVLRLDANNAVAILKGASNLICQKEVAGTYTDVYTTPYNASAMAYWRMRETGGIFYWDTSADGVAWTPRFSTTVATNLFPVSNVLFYAYAGYSGTEVAPGNAQIYDINLGLQLRASGVSTSSGSAQILDLRSITASGASTSSGSADIEIHAASVFAMTAAGASLSAGTAMIFRLSPGQLTATGQSYSSGSASFITAIYYTGIGQSFSTGTAQLVLLPVVPDTTITQYFYFEPPVAYDRPTTLPPPFPQYRNSYARWQKGQARGRSVLRTGSVCQVLDTPTVDQTLAADAYYAGGHVYVIDNIEADKLAACGLMVRPIPIQFTLYPEEEVFPLSDLSPGYEELIIP